MASTSMDLPIPIIDVEGDPVEGATKLREACTQHGFFFGNRNACASFGRCNQSSTRSAILSRSS